MSQATNDQMLQQVRGLAPGFVVAFAGRKNKTLFPHITVRALREATPDRLAFLCELSDVRGRTLEEVIAATAEQTGAKPKNLQSFARCLAEAGYLVPNPAPARFDAEPHLDLSVFAPLTDSQLLQMPQAVGFLVDGGRIVWIDHGGTLRLRLTIAEFFASCSFLDASTRATAWSKVAGGDAADRMTRDAFDALVDRLYACGVVRQVEAVREERTKFRPGVTNARAVILAGTREAIAAHRRAVESRPGVRAAVVPVNDHHNMAPLSLGLLTAYAQELEGGRLQQRYDFVPMFLGDEDMFLEWTARPAIFLFSNYVWNVERNLELSAMIKAANPANLMIHGGPSTPKYENDCHEFFHANPHVDVTVRGEGEATFAAILDALDPGQLQDLEPLRSVEGLSFRGREGVVTTCDRDRIADLDTIPSPYLLGLFEPFGRAHAAAVMESNRGCPYGCTFCDWGSATLSRIRKFDMDRVKDELEWFSRNEIMYTSICDANFGILERDVEIAEHLAALKTKYGYPKTAALNYAKNTIKHLHKIIEAFASVDLVIEPTLALQTTDETTLKIIRRSNIKTEKYDELAIEFRRTGMPLASDIMMGLPGSTVTSFRNDLQRCTDSDVRARVNPTLLLPNSPMNEPSYREEHGIVARPHEYIKETKTYTRDEFDEMERLGQMFYLLDNFGILRHIARFVRSDVGLKEVDFYDRISREALEQPLRWPFLASTMRLLMTRMAPPSSWSLFIDDVGDYLINELGVEAGTALDTALAVQLAHLPEPTREMPTGLQLEHDYVAWNRSLLEIRDAGHRDDWESIAPRLHTFGPGELKVSDPRDICGTGVGRSLSAFMWTILGWDMKSPVARPT